MLQLIKTMQIQPLWIYNVAGAVGYAWIDNIDLMLKIVIGLTTVMSGILLGMKLKQEWKIKLVELKMKELEYEEMMKEKRNDK